MATQTINLYAEGLEILLDEGIDPLAKSQKIDDQFRGGPVETDTRSKGGFQAKSLGDLMQLIGMAHYLGYACVGLVLSLVATTTVMSVQDRIKEHAVLQMIGFSGPRVFRLAMIGVVVSLVAGTLAGIAPALHAARTDTVPALRQAWLGSLVAIESNGEML